MLDLTRGDVSGHREPCTYCSNLDAPIEANVEVPIEPVDPHDPDARRLAAFEVCIGCAVTVLQREQTRDGDPFVIVALDVILPDALRVALRSPW